jgi:hypothetical protein
MFSTCSQIADKSLVRQFLKGILWGPSSLENNASSRARPKTVGHKWGIKQSKITAGAIAFVAVVVSDSDSNRDLILTQDVDIPLGSVRGVT